MFTFTKHTAVLGAALFACASVAAQTAARPNPLNASAAVPAMTYQSPLATFATSAGTRSENQPLAWREANDNVARIGGWRVYAREAQTSDAAPAAAPAAALAPVMPVVSTSAVQATSPVPPSAAAVAPFKPHQHPKP